MGTKRKCSEDSELSPPSKTSRLNYVLARGNNSLMMLNEMGIKGLKWNVEQIINEFPQRFRGSCQFTEPFAGRFEVIPTGCTFYAEGTNKVICRHEIADKIVLVLSGKKSFKTLNGKDCSNEATGPVDIDLSANQKNPNNSYTEVANLVQKSAPVTPVTVPVTNQVNIEDSVRILNEKFKDLEYKFELHQDGYHCIVEFRGINFKGIGTSKKIAKRNVASQILRKYLKFTFLDDKTNKQDVTEETYMELQKIPPNRQKNFSNLVQSMVKNMFERSVINFEVQYSKRKVLAGIVMSRNMKNIFPQYYQEVSTNHSDVDMPNLQIVNDNELSNLQTNTNFKMDPLQFTTQTGWTINPDDPGEILKLITLTSGTKCLSGGELNFQGNVLNDCHAEVVSKRALQLFIYKTIERLQNNITAKPGDELYGCDILQQYSPDNAWLYSLKSDVKFHLYITSAPCGDSRIFLTQNFSTNNTIIEESDEEQDEDSHPNRKNRGLLRTKIECGEGTIPIKTKHIQTWDGILGGERLLTMSCSDKVCMWNVLGLQGALLSNMLNGPVYLDSIVVGSMHHQDHMQRALYERAQPLELQEDWKTMNNVTATSIAYNNNEIIVNSNNQSLIGDGHPANQEEGEVPIVLDLDNQFFVNKPLILTVTDQDERCPGKASNYSLNWILGEDCLEIIHTTKGITTDNRPSRLCKRNLFKIFLRVFKFRTILSSSSGLCESGDNSSSNAKETVNYSDYKNLLGQPDNSLGSVRYQLHKICLFKYFDTVAGYGRWIGKPVEQDWFSVKATVTEPSGKSGNTSTYTNFGSGTTAKYPPKVMECIGLSSDEEDEDEVMEQDDEDDDEDDDDDVILVSTSERSY